MCYGIYSIKCSVWTSLKENPDGGLEEMSILTYKSHKCYSLLGWAKIMNSQQSLPCLGMWTPLDSLSPTADMLCWQHWGSACPGRRMVISLSQKEVNQAFVLPAMSPGTPTFRKPCDLHQRFRCQVQLLTWPLVSWTKNYVTMARNQAFPVTLQLHEENQPVDSCGHLPLCGGFDGNDHSQSGLGLLHCPHESFLCSLSTRKILSPTILLFVFWWELRHILTEHFLLFPGWHRALRCILCPIETACFGCITFLFSFL